MRVFWHNGALMIEPEGEREGKLLVELAGNLKFGRPSGMQNRIPSGDTPLGSEGVLERLTGNHQSGPSSLSRKTNDKQHVVSINK
jgi:hypothetical protein